MAHLGRTHIDCLMGKGWGGELAARFACSAGRSEPDGVVRRLVVAAPTATNPMARAVIPLIKCPALVCWAEDDEVCSFSDSRVWSTAGTAVLFKTLLGGHAISEDISERTVAFARKQAPAGGAGNAWKWVVSLVGSGRTDRSEQAREPLRLVPEEALSC